MKQESVRVVLVILCLGMALSCHKAAKAEGEEIQYLGGSQMENEQTEIKDEQADTRPGAPINNVGVLDLREFESGDLARIGCINNVGVILVPESLAAELMDIPMNNTGSIIPIPEGANVRVAVHTGKLKMTGEALANPGGNAEDIDILVLTGKLLITTPVEKVGYKELIVTGKVLAPRGSETALATGLTRLTGQVVYYPPGARFFMDEVRLGRDFFELLEEPIAMVIMDECVIESGVSVDLLRDKVSEIVLLGEVTAPGELVGILQVLTIENYGEILSEGDE